MKNTILVLVVVSMTLPLLCASAEEVSWTGGGASAAWDDADNWGGSLPTSEDVAVISGVVPATRADIETMNGFGGVKIDGEESKIAIYGVANDITMTAPLSGTGIFSVTNSSNSKYVVLNNDNSAFDGTIYTDSAGLSLKHVNAAGSSLAKAIIINGNANKYFMSRYDAQTGKCKVFPGDIVFENVEVYLNPSGGFTFNGTVDLRKGTCQFRNDTPIAYATTFAGSITNSSAGAGGGGNSSQLKLNNNFIFTKTCKINLGSKSSIDLFNSGIVNLNCRIASASKLIVDNFTLNFGEEYALPSEMPLELGARDHYPRKARINLNGFSQHCGDLSSAVADMNVNFYAYYDTADISISGNYMTADKAKIEAGYITSPAPATFTVLGTYTTTAGSGTYTDEQKKRFIYPIQGHASFELNSTNQATAATMRFSSPRSTTDGSLICRRGTIVLEATSAFTNLSSIVASNVGQISVENGATINPDMALLLSDSSVFTVGEGSVVTAKTAKVGGTWLEPDEYVCSEAGFPNLAGAGTLVVKTYGGPKGLILMFK